MKIGVCGYGYVGKAMYRFFSKKYETVVYDPAYVGAPAIAKFQFENDGELERFKKECNNPNAIFKVDADSLSQTIKLPLTNIIVDKADINTCDLAVICVPTPMKKDGSCDISIVEETVEWLEVPLILCKSTVPPGTTHRLSYKYGRNIVFSPEYMGESSYYTPPNWVHPTDLEKHPFQIFGGEKISTSKMVDIFIPIMGPHVKFKQTDSTTAEFIKYWENVFGAVRVAFFNEMYNACKAFGIDYWEARDGWLLDNRVEACHSAVFVNNRGFSGKCFPKDLMAFISAAEKAGCNMKILKEVWNTNTDWHPEFKRIEE